MDYSNPATWNAETLKPDNISIKGTWRSGYHKALSMLPIADAEDMEDSNTTLRCPSKPGVVVGVGSVAEIDWSIVGDDVDNEVEQVNDTDVGEVNLAEIIDDPDNTAGPYFVIDGKKVYKTSCLKAISSSEQLSKDRLRRVRGMSRYPGDKEINRGVESFLLIGDPVLVNNSKDGPIIANIAKITKSNQVLKQIDISSDNQIKDVELTLRQIDTEVIDGKLFRKGTTSSDTFKCIGDNCLPIRPSIELNPPEGMTKYVFDISLMRDMGVHLKLSTPPSQETECASSASSIIKKRCHIAQHILW